MMHFFMIHGVDPLVEEAVNKKRKKETIINNIG
jgi:hypothetical protein